METNYEIKTKRCTFLLVSNTDVKKSCFFCRAKILYQQCLTFLSFMNILRSSHLQMFFKIGALKNFAIFLIEQSPTQMFSCKYCKFLQNFSGGCFCIILKVIKQLFCKDYFSSLS